MDFSRMLDKQVSNVNLEKFNYNSFVLWMFGCCSCCQKGCLVADFAVKRVICLLFLLSRGVWLLFLLSKRVPGCFFAVKIGFWVAVFDFF